MKIVYTPISVPPALRDVYVIKFNFEHGDADLTTSEECHFDFGNSSLETYLKMFEEVSEAISYSRSSGVDLPDDFEDTAFVLINGEEEYVPLERDKIYGMNVSNYFAKVSIESILWYSSQSSARFKVSYE